MNLKKKLNACLLIASVLMTAGCNKAISETKPFFNQENQSSVFFDNPFLFKSVEDVESILTKTWDYPSELAHPQHGNKHVATCIELQEFIEKGYSAAKDYEQTVINAQATLCLMWQKMARLKPYKKTYFDSLSHSKEFADQMPAQFALLISKEQEEKAATAGSWNEVSQIHQVKRLNDLQATYYDTSGGIQRLSLMAKGDYNYDGLEDRIYYMENSVEGGSYSSAKAYIITRLGTDKKVKILTEI